MSVVENAVVVAIHWVLVGYTVLFGLIFVCLMVLTLATMLGWEPRSERMPTDREWARMLAAWTRDAEENHDGMGIA